MKALLITKQQLMRFYTRYEAYVLPLLKFLATLITLNMINKNIGYMTKLKNPAIVLIISLVCSFMPANVIILIAGFVIVAHLYSLSLQCAVVVLIVFVIMYALYFRFTPKDALAVMLTPVCYMLKIPYLMPLSLGFVGNPLSSISVGCGTVTYFIIEYIKSHEEALSSTGGSLSEIEDTLSGFKGIIDGLLKNDEMFLMIIVFAFIIVMVYLVRRLKVNYSWQIALGIGSVMGIVILMVGSAALDTDVSIGTAIFGMIVSVLLVIVLQFFVFNVDYSRAEQVQFEDDDYYYYVKAVPKVNLEAPRTRSRRSRRIEDEYFDEEDDDDDDYYD